MTKERAQEILNSGNGFTKNREYTESEWWEVKKVWDTMPGDCSWTSALIKISKGG